MTMTINGSGTITGLSAGGLPDATIVQADLAAGVAGNGPAFSAYQSTLQNLTANTYTKLQVQTEEFDTNSYFNNTGSTVGSIPPYAFLPNIAGYYTVSIGCQLATTAADVRTSIYKNGSNFKNVGASAPSSNWTEGSALVYLNGSTDYIEAYVLSTATNTTYNNQAATFFQAVLVRAA